MITCRDNDINPYNYFRRLFTALPKLHSSESLLDLMP
ncbi:transposase domain-containing protein [Xenorhabdus bovienii]